MRRAFWEVLVDMAESVGPTASEAGIRITTLEIEAPLEIQLRQSGSEMQFLADVPRWRWRTDFDEKPCRMRVVMSEGEPS
jgi:hypothetical protein